MWMLQTAGSVGYMVVTIPKEFWIKDKKMLKKFRRYIVRKLKRMGIKYGKARYHWAGDENRCFYPHLNILMGSGWIDRSVLDELKNDVAEWFGVSGQVVIEYHYTKDIKKILHWVEYVCRPTLNLIEDNDEKWFVWYSVVKNFVNDVEWGKPGMVDMPSVINIDDVSDMSEADKNLFWLFMGRCPYCRRKLKWRRIRDGDLEDVVFRKILDCGYEELIR
jgi:hypothetical protein